MEYIKEVYKNTLFMKSSKNLFEVIRAMGHSYRNRPFLFTKRFVGTDELWFPGENGRY